MPFIPFEELDVYRMAEELSDRDWDIVRKWDPFLDRLWADSLFERQTGSVPTSPKVQGAAVPPTIDASSESLAGR